MNKPTKTEREQLLEDIAEAVSWKLIRVTLWIIVTMGALKWILG